jgi:hypothetical protein
VADAIIDALSAFVQTSVYTSSSSSSLPMGKEQVTVCHSASKVSFLGGPIYSTSIHTSAGADHSSSFGVGQLHGTSGSLVCQLSYHCFSCQRLRLCGCLCYLVQSPTRTLTVAFHIGGHDHFESFIDAVASMLQHITIAGVVALVDDTIPLW